TFLFTTPGVWQPGYGFPFPSPMPGQFIAKDLILLGAAIWSAGEALRAEGWRNDSPGANRRRPCRPGRARAREGSGLPGRPAVWRGCPTAGRLEKGYELSYNTGSG
ncbi:MAG: DUF417 family protein, partial [Gemmatimonadales bacterium]|nr:DUF417 family protein [Gemmatimonadales bacterium]